MLERILSVFRTKSKPEDARQIVPMLTGVHEKYATYETSGNTKEVLHDMIQTIHNDVDLRNIARLSHFPFVMKIEEGYNLCIDEKGLFIYEFVTGYGHYELGLDDPKQHRDVETRVKACTSPSLTPDTLKSAVMNYIREAPYHHLW